VVTVDKNGLNGLTASHSIERYMATTAFLTNQASDKDGPFHSHGLADALRTGGNFVRDIRLEIGSDKNDVLRPFADDRFSLAGARRFDLERGAKTRAKNEKTNDTLGLCGLVVQATENVGTELAGKPR
jgi:hypothetical protein